MKIRPLLLGSTVLAGLAATQSATPVDAAEVKPIGALDIGIGGFMRWYAFGGHIGGKTQDNAGSYDFRNDTEVFVYATGKDEATGLDYGARIELEADGDASVNADETFAWIKGTFGEFRFGDANGASELQVVSVATFSAFTGGLDGAGPLDMVSAERGADSDDATKIIYITPTLAGFNAVVSFTPRTGSDSGGKGVGGDTNDGAVDDLFEGGLAYRGDFGDVGLIASVIGHYGHFNDSGSGTSDTYKVFAGLNLSLFGFTVGGGWGYGQGIGVATAGNAGDAIFERGTDAQWYNVGVGGAVGPANVSLTFGQVYKSDGGDPDVQAPEPWEVVLGVDYGLAPGFVIGAEVAYFDVDLDKSTRERADKGVLGLIGIRTSF